MTTIPNLTPYSGAIPDKVTMDNNTFANAVHPFMAFYDTTTVPEINIHRDAMNTLSTEITAVSDNIVVMRDEVIVMRDIVLDASNYEGDWVAGSTYASGASISYTDGWIYYSKKDNNTDEPSSEISTDSWYFSGRKTFVYSTITANYTAQELDYLNINASGGSFTITLPAIHTKNMIIALNSGADVETNNVTVDGNGSNLRSGNTVDTVLIVDKNGIEIKFKSDGTLWEVL